MSTRSLARGGILTAGTVALLCIGGAIPPFTLVSAVLAGVMTAVPLLYHERVCISVLIYLASSVLSLVLAPQKEAAIAFAVLLGLYPIVKYVIEAHVPRRGQAWCKWGVCTVYAGVLTVALWRGWLPQAEALRDWMWVPPLLCYPLFALYDSGLSGLLARIGRRLPHDGEK